MNSGKPLWEKDGQIQYDLVFEYFDQKKYKWDGQVSQFFEQNLSKIIADARAELASITEDGKAHNTGVMELENFIPQYSIIQIPAFSEDEPPFETPVLPNPAAVMLLHRFFAKRQEQEGVDRNTDARKWLNKKVVKKEKKFIKQTIKVGDLIVQLGLTTTPQPLLSDNSKEIYSKARAIINGKEKTWAEKVRAQVSSAQYFKEVRTEADKFLEKGRNTILLSVKENSQDTYKPLYVESTMQQRFDANLRGMVWVANRYAPNNAKLFEGVEAGDNKAVEALVSKLREALLTPPANIKEFGQYMLEGPLKLYQDDLRKKYPNSPYFIRTSSDSRPVSQEIVDDSLYLDIIARQDIQYTIAAREMYVEMLEMYKRELITGRSQQLPEREADHKQFLEKLNQEIYTCKKQLYSLKAVCAENHIGRERAVGGAIGFIPGAAIAVGGLVAMYGKAEAANVAIEALKEVFQEGSFTKLSEGLASGNPILWSLVAGICLGTVGVIVGIISAAEVASHIRSEAYAAEYMLDTLKSLSEQQISRR